MNTGSSLRSPLIVVLALALAAIGPMRAADPDSDSGRATAPLLNPLQLDQLLGPIALYPDALVALILPAATSPTEIVLAARYLNAKGDPTKVDDQPWSDSVKALARYPDIVKWMDENLQWTKQVGESFLAQPADLMDAVQRLRARARATGALVDTPQQQVVVDGDTIEILPVQPDVIYIPRYDPDLVYVMQPPGYVYPYGSYLSFGAGFPIGLWLTYDFDWYRRVIWVGDRRHDWREHRDWRRHQPPGQSTYPSNPNWHPWNPPANRPPPSRDYRHGRPEIEHPRPFPGTPITPRPPRHDDDRRPSRPDPGTPRPPNTAPDTPRPPRTDFSNPRPPRTDNGTPRPPRTDVSPRPDRPSSPPPSNVVAPRNPPEQRMQPPPSPAIQPLLPAGNQQRASVPGNPPAASSPGPNRPPPSSPPPVPRNFNPPPSPPPPQQQSPPPSKSRDGELREKEN